ncbi:WD40-repeat-containing domain protein, partial [Blastocladiella britannica]
MAPIRKKARSDAPAIVVAPPTQPAAPPSSVFAPFRAMGTVCNDVPFDIQALGSNHFMTTAVGNAFHVYNVDKFRLMIASGQTPEPITALGSFRETTYAACRNVVHTFARGKLVGALASPDIDGAIFQLLVLGTVVLALSDDNRLTVWDAKSGEVTASLDFGPTFTASCFMHPHTYLNKVVIGSSQGSMQLWNVSSSKLIYEFAAVGSPVCTLAQSPVVDVVAIGLVDGHIHLHNLRLDERIASFHQDSRVTAISFRT